MTAVAVLERVDELADEAGARWTLLLGGDRSISDIPATHGFQVQGPKPFCKWAGPQVRPPTYRLAGAFAIREGLHEE